MSYDLNTIRGAVKAVFDSCASLAYVYDRRNPNVEGYPCVIFDIERNDSEMLTNVENLRTITFRAWIVVEIPADGAAAANTRLDNSTTEVITALESITNLELGGEITWLPPVQGARQEVTSPTGNLIWQVVDVRARIITSIL